MDNVVAINFSRDVGWSGQEALELAKGAASTVALSFNYDGRPEIGVWRARLPDERFEAALAALRASGYETLPGGPDVVEPDTKSLALGVRRAGEDVPRIRAFPVRHPPEQIARAVAVLDGAMAEIRKHPVSVLRGRAQLGTRDIQRRQRIAVEVVLTNVGVEPLRLTTPAAGPPGEWTGIRLILIDARGTEHAVNVKAGDVRSTLAGSGSTATLAPGASLTLHVSTKVDWPPGTGQLRVEITQTAEGSADPELVTGTLWLDAGTLKVQGGSWWKFW